MAPACAELGQEAFALAKRYGLAAGDALNLAAAIRQGADEFITSELPGSYVPMIMEVVFDQVDPAPVINAEFPVPRR